MKRLLHSLVEVAQQTDTNKILSVVFQNIKSCCNKKKITFAACCQNLEPHTNFELHLKLLTTSKKKSCVAKLYITTPNDY